MSAGLTNETQNIHHNLTAEELIEHALNAEEAVLASNGALVAQTGLRTGRSPKDKFIVKDFMTENTIAWGTTNQAMAPQQFNHLWDQAFNYLESKKHYFVNDYSVAADEQYAIPVTVICQLAWHALFTMNLFIRKTLNKPSEHWTMLCVPEFKTKGAEDQVNSDAAILLNFAERKILICGTYYAGEMKKAMFSVLNFLLPDKDVLPMHCAANVGESGDTTLFFGLSGTGKTTLSADSDRYLIGDDEHGWSPHGVFNFEGGCYAKCINLSQQHEPVIWNAIKSGAIMENVCLDPLTAEPNYADNSLTENTRVAYPREHIELRSEANLSGHPNAVIFLTCDLYGVLPPVAKLTEQQAAYYFLSGYTALVGSTEVGMGKGIQQTFSTCFGAPFFSRPPEVYADLLLKRLRETGAQVYLVNTGWTGGAYEQGGERFSIPTTRQIVKSIIEGQIQLCHFELYPGFNFAIPSALPGIDRKLLNPALNWKEAEDHKKCVNLLIDKFNENFKKFADVAEDIQRARPTHLS